MSEKILVVDDDPTLRLLIKELLLANFEVEVVEAANGLQAWDMVQSGLNPGLCIMDVRMPKAGGMFVLGKLRADPRFSRQKVMLCSTVNSRATILEAAKLRVDAFLLKPFQADEFLAHVRSLLERQETKILPQLEPTDEVLKRLGIELKVYLRLLAVLCNDIHAFVQSFSGSNPGTEDEFQLRVSAIKGAVASLGATGLMDLFAYLEHVDSRRSFELSQKLLAIEAERLRIMDAVQELAKDVEQV